MLIENDALRVTVLPEMGGKIASIVALPSGTEMLQPPLVPCVPRTPDLPFDQSDASGWDECLPSVAACTLPDGVAVPDHGDLWRLSWNVAEHDATSLRMTVDAVSLPLRLARILRLAGSTLRSDYTVRNVGLETVPYVWSAHPLFAVEPGDRIVLPESVRDVWIEDSGGLRLGAAGTRLDWPMTAAGVDLARVLAPDAGVGDKLYAAAPNEGWAALERVARGLRLEVRFDPAVLPWLGIWSCYGGWPEGAEFRGYCVALEPCTAPADSLAIAIETGHAQLLAPGEEHTWSIEVRVETLSSSKEIPCRM